MSTPISSCAFIKATHDEAAFDRLVSILRRNLEHGAMTLSGCHHEPRCPDLTEEEADDLESRLAEALGAESGDDHEGGLPDGPAGLPSPECGGLPPGDVGDPGYP